MFGLGWREDVRDERDDTFASHVVYANAATPGDLSLRRYKQGRLYQNGYGACVAFSLARVLHQSLLIDDERNGRPLGASMPSPGFIYYNGRRQEAVEARSLGEADPPVIDKGSFPRLVMRGCQAVGFCTEAAYLFAQMSQDIDNYPTDNRKPPARAYMAAFDQRNLRYSRILQTGRARKDEVQRLVRARVPMLFGMTVDTAYMNNSGSIVTSIDLAQAVGGHMLSVLEAPDEGLIHDNWWGENWGNNGEGMLSWDLFGSDIIRDVYAVEAAPAFSSEAP